MACPFFYPVARFADPAFVIPPRLPLGDAYLGECRAQTPALLLAAEDLHRACNAGYGRGACSRFPSAAEDDAVRFQVGEWRDTTVAVQYIVERQCWPVRHGSCITRKRSGCSSA